MTTPEPLPASDNYAPLSRFYGSAYGIPTDKTSSASAAIQAMLDAAKAAALADGTRRSVVMDKSTKYRLTTMLTIDTTFVSFDGNGSTFDSSAITSGPAIHVTGTVGTVETNSFGNNMCRIENFRLTGSGRTQNHGGILFDSDDVKLGPARINIDRVVVTRLGVGFDYGDNAYAINHTNCETYFNAIGFRGQGAQNSGERFTYLACTTYDNDINVQLSNSGGNMKFIGCSNDYPSNGGKMFDIDAGRVTWVGGHLEASHDLGYWIAVKHGTAQLELIGTEIVVAGNKTAYTLGNIETGTGDPARDVKFCGVRLDNVYIKWGPSDTYARGTLFSGTGRVQASGVSFNDTAPGMPPISRALNLVAGDFETVTRLELWSHRSNIARDARAYEGTGSAKFAVATAGQNSNMDWYVPVTPGQLLLTSFRYQATGLTAAAATLLWRITWFTGQQGTDIAKVINVAQTNTISSDAGGGSTWALLVGAPLVVPQGAAYAKVEFLGAAWPTTVDVVVDDVIVNAV